MFRSCLLLSLAVVGCCYYPSKAEAIKLPNIASSNKFILHTYTHISTPKIEPATSFAQLDKSFKTAAVCFLGFGECGDVSFGKGDDNYDLDGDVMCQAEGYNVTACTVPSYLYNQCPYDPKYYKSCKEDTDKACKDAGYVSSCADGYIKDETQICPYSDSYYKCKCNPCDGYSYTLSEATADGYVTDGSCNSCGTTKYKRKENPCTGYLTCECGGEIGTPTCKSGTVTKYQTCKTCCEYKCSEASCPDGYICEIETCSNKYCIIGCKSGYGDLNTYWSDCLLGCWLSGNIINGYGCVKIPDCSSLGFSQTVSDCSGKKYLVCPFNCNQVFCLSD